MVPLRHAVVLIFLTAIAGCASAVSSGTDAGYWTKGRMLGARGARGHHPQPPSPGSTPEAKQNAKTLRVGALFNSDSSGDHFCTASVVDSPGQNVIVTAAHCVNDGKGGGNKQNVAFAPGYANGQTPYGVWTPKRYFMDARWTSGADDRFDVAFLVLEPLNGQNIEQVIGGSDIEFNGTYNQFVRVSGYPSSADAPIACWNWTSQFENYLKFDCGGYYSGTSGSPFVTRSERQGSIVGVLGGYQEGGNTPDVSYSDYFGDDIKKLYQQATATG